MSVASLASQCGTGIATEGHLCESPTNSGTEMVDFCGPRPSYLSQVLLLARQRSAPVLLSLVSSHSQPADVCLVPEPGCTLSHGCRLVKDLSTAFYVRSTNKVRGTQRGLVRDWRWEQVGNFVVTDKPLSSRETAVAFSAHCGFSCSLKLMNRPPKTGKSKKRVTIR